MIWPRPSSAARAGRQRADGQRLGGYAKYTFELTKGVPLELTLVGGHQFVSGANSAGVGGGEGTYGTVEIDTNF